MLTCRKANRKSLTIHIIIFMCVSIFYFSFFLTLFKHSKWTIKWKVFFFHVCFFIIVRWTIKFIISFTQEKVIGDRKQKRSFYSLKHTKVRDKKVTKVSRKIKRNVHLWKTRLYVSFGDDNLSTCDYKHSFIFITDLELYGIDMYINMSIQKILSSHS